MDSQTNRRPPKRSKPDTIEVSGSSSSSSSLSTPSFLVLHSDVKQLSRVSPFLISKALQGLAGTIKNAKKLPSGDLLVETASASQSECLLKSTMLSDIPIIVTPHSSLNSSRGVISESDLIDLTNEELTEGFSPFGVTNARRITMKKGDDIIRTKHIILTFSTPTLPNRITAGYLSCPVRPYIPNPVRCFKCQKYGHVKTACRSKPACGKCSSTDHITEECTSEKPCCLNCNGDHPAFSRSCPKWTEEKEVQRVKITQNISFQEARRQVVRQNIATTYASAVKTTCTQSTQTAVSIPPTQSFSSNFRSIMQPSIPTPEKQSSSTNTDLSTSKVPPRTAKQTKLQKYASITQNRGSKKGSRNPSSKIKTALANRYAELEDDVSDDNDDEMEMAQDDHSNKSQQRRLDRSRFGDTQPTTHSS